MQGSLSRASELLSAEVQMLKLLPGGADETVSGWWWFKQPSGEILFEDDAGVNLSKAVRLINCLINCMTKSGQFIYLSFSS